MRRLLLAIVLPLSLASPPAGASSCAEGLLVAGVFLWGRGEPPGPLPPPAGRVGAAVPGCGDQDSGEVYDEPVEATRLRDVPATIAVTRRGRLYMADGVLAAMGGHPLRALAPTPPRGRCRPHSTPLRGRVEHADLARLVLRGGGTLRVVHVDRRTRFTDRPVLQPLLRPQRVLVRTSLCDRKRIADRITFLGPSVVPNRSPLDVAPLHVRERPWLLAGLLAGGLVLAAAILTLRARRA